MHVFLQYTFLQFSDALFNFCFSLARRKFDDYIMENPTAYYNLKTTERISIL
jgi:hypothetical protein